MIDHLSSYAMDFPATRRFYASALSTLGYGVQFEMALDDDPDLPGRRCCAFGPAGRSIFWVIEVREAASPRHVAFQAESRDAVQRSSASPST